MQIEISSSFRISHADSITDSNTIDFTLAIHTVDDGLQLTLNNNMLSILEFITTDRVKIIIFIVSFILIDFIKILFKYNHIKYNKN